jgi:hypothetical protein
MTVKATASSASPGHEGKLLAHSRHHPPLIGGPPRACVTRVPALSAHRLDGRLVTAQGSRGLIAAQCRAS